MKSIAIYIAIVQQVFTVEENPVLLKYAEIVLNACDIHLLNNVFLLFCKGDNLKKSVCVQICDI